MNAEVIINIQPDGTTTVEASGWQGPTCSTITEPYRKALGTEKQDHLKPEYFAQQTQQVQQGVSQ